MQSRGSALHDDELGRRGMILTLPMLLDSQQLSEICENLSAITYASGAATAGWHARLVKNNDQADEGQATLDRIRGVALQALQTNPSIIGFALPHRISPLLLNRYREGMSYGAHVDDAIRVGNPPMRADISFTLFLNDPESYEGGALIAASGGVERSVKLSAGGIVLYPADSLHRVEPVTSGERIALVGWMQSLVRDPARREILFDLDSARRELFEGDGKTPLFDTLSKSHSNLLRMWSEL